MPSALTMIAACIDAEQFAREAGDTLAENLWRSRRQVMEEALAIVR